MELISLYSKKIICSQLLIREPSLQVPVKAVKKKNIYYFGPNKNLFKYKLTVVIRNQ